MNAPRTATTRAHGDPGGFDVAWGAATDTGLRRPDNQDALVADPPLFVVADGMGGHLDGQLAAQAVVRAFRESVTTRWLSAEHVEAATAQAFEAVRSLGADRPRAAGSTVSGVGLCLHQGVPSWLVFNLGDSRTYLHQQHRLEQVTVDHSQVQELVDGGMSPEEAMTRASSHVITRAIGGGIPGMLHPDQWLLPAHRGDRILICSDGLTDEVGDSDLDQLLASAATPQEAADALVAAALRAGGRDNVTAVVVEATTVGVSSSVVARSSPGDEDTVPLRHTQEHPLPLTHRGDLA